MPTSFSEDAQSSTTSRKNSISSSKDEPILNIEKVTKSIKVNTKGTSKSTKVDASAAASSKKNTADKKQPSTGLKKKTKITGSKMPEVVIEKSKKASKGKKAKDLTVETVFDAMPIETLSSPINDSIASVEVEKDTDNESEGKKGSKKNKTETKSSKKLDKKK